MDTPLLILAGGALLVAVAALLAWRGRSETVIRVPAGPSAPGASEGGSAEPAPAIDAAQAADLAQRGLLVPVTHPMVLRAAEQALRKGGPMTKYVARHEGQVYLTFEALPDPEERARAYELFRRFNAGEELDVGEMLRVIAKIGQ